MDRRLSFLYLCDPEGVINTLPCNPTEGNGLLRAMKLIEEARGTEERFLFVSGNLFLRTKKKKVLYEALHYKVQVDFLSRLYGNMGVTAAVPGLNDLIHGVREFKDLTVKNGIQVVCANLVTKGDERPVFDPYVIKELNGFKIGIFGLINQNIMSAEEDAVKQGRKNMQNVPIAGLLTDGEYVIQDPLECAEKVSRQLRQEGVDMVVSLCFLSVRRIKEILNTTPVDLAVGNDMCKKDGYRALDGGIRVHTTTLSQSLGRIDYHFKGPFPSKLGDMSRVKALEAQIEEARSSYESLARTGNPDPNRLKGLSNEMKKLKEEHGKIVETSMQSYFENHHIPVKGFITSDEGTPGRLWEEYLQLLPSATVGHEAELEERLAAKADAESLVIKPSACMECHPVQYAHWAGTRHASSFQSVSSLGCDHHPRCFKCHSTGFSCMNGYSLPPPPTEFGSINCEVCHGSLGEHVSDFLVLPRSIRGGEEGAEAKLCSFCHDAKHSPEFDFEYHRSQVACPIIDYGADPTRTLLEEKAADMQRAMADGEGLKESRNYFQLARIMGQMGAGDAELAAVLMTGHEKFPHSPELVYPLYPILFKQKRLTDALAVMEEYIAGNQNDPMINLEIMRLLIMATDPMVKNLEAGKNYARWFLANIDGNNAEVLLLLATANMQLGSPEDAAQNIKQAESQELTPKMKEWISLLKQELKRSDR